MPEKECLQWKAFEAMEAYCTGNQALLDERTEEIDVLEHEADKIKQKIRASIPSSVRLPVNKKISFHSLNSRTP